MKKLAIAALAALAMSGCSQRVADLTVASTLNVDMNSQGFVEGKRVEGSDTKIAVIFPLGIPNVETAVDDAIKDDKCVVGLADAVVEHSWFYLYLGFFSYDVEGTQIIDTEKPGCENRV
ncbi:hypothetical protein C9J01_23035 [Photobacterium rosenbergii]|uniref:Lipoprotein n=1 Tax=Photobacterium rosenbergii TaxID=294936 RepID=A0A2T3N779_9GAMM|nr:hypothetical protein [Photobacterium rosenbergii]PSW08736.1 hypothetical protein C9J01_23035 [Photobacterium rosenbergii]